MVLRFLEVGFPIGRPGNVFLSGTGRQHMHLVLMHNTLVVLMMEGHISALAFAGYEVLRNWALCIMLLLNCQASAFGLLFPFPP